MYIVKKASKEQIEKAVEQIEKQTSYINLFNLDTYCFSDSYLRFLKKLKERVLAITDNPSHRKSNIDKAEKMRKKKLEKINN